MVELVYPVDSKLRVLPLVTASSGRKKGSGTAEMLPVVQEDGLVTAMAERSYCHSQSRLLHPVVHMHLIDRDGMLYLQRRSLRKDPYPGEWDIAVGGHVIYGESLLEALRREAAEELGLYAFNPVHLSTYTFDNGEECELVTSYVAVGHPHLSPDGVEVIDGRWWSIRELEKSRGDVAFTPVFLSEFKKFRRQLLSML